MWRLMDRQYRPEVDSSKIYICQDGLLGEGRTSSRLHSSGFPCTSCNGDAEDGHKIDKSEADRYHLRKKVGKENLELLETLVQLRHRLARLLGYPNYSDFAIEPKLART